MPTTEVHFDGVRVRYDSAKNYDEVVTALLADIGEKPVPIDDFSKRSTAGSPMNRRSNPTSGPSGFMLFGLVQSRRLDYQGRHHRKVLRVVLGNPLIAITMCDTT